MINKNLNSQRGITIVSLVITIIVLLILTGTVIYNMNSSSKVGAYNNMVADINLLEDKLLNYFNKYGEIPKTSRTITIESIDYYEIDLGKLDNITLKYGEDYGENTELTNASDVYLVNDSLEVYYLQGIDLSNVKRHEN